MAATLSDAVSLASLQSWLTVYTPSAWTKTLLSVTYTRHVIMPVVYQHINRSITHLPSLDQGPPVYVRVCTVTTWTARSSAIAFNECLTACLGELLGNWYVSIQLYI